MRRRALPELSRHHEDVAGTGAPPRVRTEVLWRGRIHLRLTAGQHRARVRSPPAIAVPVAAGHRRHPVDRSSRQLRPRRGPLGARRLRRPPPARRPSPPGRRARSRAPCGRSGHGVVDAARLKCTPSTRASTEVAVAPPGTVIAASSPDPSATRAGDGGSLSRTRARSSNSPMATHHRASRLVRPSLRCGVRGTASTTSAPDRRRRGSVRHPAAAQ